VSSTSSAALVVALYEAGANDDEIAVWGRENEAGWTRDQYEQRTFEASVKLIPLLKP